MRVLNAVLTPLHTPLSGALVAGTQLALHVAEHADVDLAIMARQTRVSRLGPRLRRLECASRSLNDLRLGPLRVPRFLGTPLTTSSLPRVLRAGGYDVVHVHNPHPTLALVQLALACRRARVPYVISSHGFVEFSDWPRAYGFGPLRRWLFEQGLHRAFRLAVRGAAAVLVTSPQDREIAAQLGVDAQRVYLVSNGVSREFLAPPSPDGAASVRAKYGIAEDRVLLLFLGNLTPNKGVDLLLEAVARIREPVQVAIVGNPEADPAYGAKLRALAARAPHPVQLTGLVSDEDRLHLLGACDLFVFPSRSDTLPLAVLEAMALERPVVAARVGGIPFQVTAETGWLFDAGCAGSLAERLEQALAERASWSERGRAGRRRVRERFTWERAGREAVSVYRRVLKEC